MGQTSREKVNQVRRLVTRLELDPISFTLALPAL